jgi:hypothetical protein
VWAVAVGAAAALAVAVPVGWNALSGGASGGEAGPSAQASASSPEAAEEIAVTALEAAIEALTADTLIMSRGSGDGGAEYAAIDGSVFHYQLREDGKPTDEYRIETDDADVEHWTQAEHGRGIWYDYDEPVPSGGGKQSEIVGEVAALKARLASAADPSNLGGLTVVGEETVDGVTALHLRIDTSVAKVDGFPRGAAFPQGDIWLDTASGLPVRVSYAIDTDALATAPEPGGWPNVMEDGEEGYFLPQPNWCSQEETCGVVESGTDYRWFERTAQTEELLNLQGLDQLEHVTLDQVNAMNEAQQPDATDGKD